MQYYWTMIIRRKQDPALRIQQEKLPGVDAAIERETKRKEKAAFREEKLEKHPDLVPTGARRALSDERLLWGVPLAIEVSGSKPQPCRPPPSPQYLGTLYSTPAGR